MTEKKVVILMATYNGQKYLKCQLDSIIQQTYRNWQLIIRDDCSKDNTVKIIQEYEKKDNRIKVIDNEGKNLGAIGNFFELIKKAPDASYYAFSDQDDYWHEDKIEKAVERLEQMSSKNGENIPLAYCGAKEITNEKLEVTAVSTFKNPRTVWENALVENLCTGCTCVINKKLKDMIRKNPPAYTVMHDWWIYLIATSLGMLYYDEIPYIKYRQHNDNAYGDINDKTSLWKYRFKQLFSKRGEVYKQIESFLDIYGKYLDTNKRKTAQLLVASKKNIFLRIKVLCMKSVFRQNKNDNMVAAFLVLTGKL